MKKLSVLLLLFFTSSTSFAADYCLSVRGNGELIASHWGAMASVVEKLGLPRAQAGGSSASISMFLLDSIATSDLVKQDPNTAVFLIKSLEGMTYWIKNQQQWKDFAQLASIQQSLVSIDWAQDLNAFFSSLDTQQTTDAVNLVMDNLSRIQKNIESGKKLNLIKMESFSRLTQAVKVLQNTQNKTELTLALKTAKFYAGELYKTYEVFGKFNAESDSNLFFRSGIVNFEGLAHQAGRIAAFYASATAKNRNWKNLYASCSGNLQNKTWSELVAAQPECQQQLEALTNTFFKSSQDDFSQKEIGQAIVSFPITSVLTDSAYEEARHAMAQYHKSLDPEFGKNFKITNPQDVYFGYWGSESALQTIAYHLDPQDAKSQRFMALNSAPWLEALRLSPAEPGLSPLQQFSANGTNYLSAGGWPDLTPTLILKAYGCKNVVHITRRGGESLFAQGVAKRLLNLERDWSLLRTTPDVYEANWSLNNSGDPDDLISLWSHLYNVANTQSSFKKSIAAADAILCTDWNQFSITDGPTPMIEHAYRSPYSINKNGGLLKASPLLEPQIDSSQGDPLDYVGCLQ